jgi:hypothetical protein
MINHDHISSWSDIINHDYSRGWLTTGITGGDGGEETGEKSGLSGRDPD